MDAWEFYVVAVLLFVYFGAVILKFFCYACAESRRRVRGERRNRTRETSRTTPSVYTIENGEVIDAPIYDPPPSYDSVVKEPPPIQASKINANKPT